eukprot:6474718-Amphidinium_carterae.1
MGEDSDEARSPTLIASSLEETRGDVELDPAPRCAEVPGGIALHEDTNMVSASAGRLGEPAEERDSFDGVAILGGGCGERDSPGRDPCSSSAIGCPGELRQTPYEERASETLDTRMVSRDQPVSREGNWAVSSDGGAMAGLQNFMDSARPSVTSAVKFPWEMNPWLRHVFT